MSVDEGDTPILLSPQENPSPSRRISWSASRIYGRNSFTSSTKSQELYSSLIHKSSQNTFESAYDKFIEKDYDEALIICNEVFQNNPTYMENIILLSTIHFNLKNYEIAIIYNNILLQIDPYCCEAYNNKGLCYKEINEYEKSVECFLSAIKVNKKFILSFLNLSLLYYSHHQLSLCLATLKTAHMLNPNNYIILYYYGTLLKRLDGKENINDSEKYLLKCIKYQSNFIPAYNSIVEIYIIKRDYDKAVHYANKAFKMDESNIYSINALGWVNFVLQKYQDSCTLFNSSLMLKSDSITSNIGYSLCLIKMRKYNEIFRYINKCFCCNDPSWKLLCNIGNYYRYTNNYVESLKYYLLALKKNPTNSYIYNNIGVIYHLLHHYKKAYYCYITAISFSNSCCSSSHCNLGCILYEFEREKESIDEMELSIKNDKTVIKSYYNLAVIYFNKKNYSETIKYCKMLLKYDKQFSECYLLLGICYFYTLKYNEAIKCFNQSIELYSQISPEIYGYLACCCSSLCMEKDKERYKKKLDGYLNHYLMIKNDEHIPSTMTPYYLLLLNYNPEIILRLSQHIFKYKFPSLSTQIKPVFTNYFLRSKQLNIGFISSWNGCRQARVAMLQICKYISHKKYNVICFNLYNNPHSTHQNFQRIVRKISNRFVDLDGKSIKEIQHEINENKIHILIYLDGYYNSAMIKMLKYRYAPLQISYMYPSTLGNNNFDYILTDPLLTPPETQQYFTEKFLPLKNCFIRLNRNDSDIVVTDINNENPFNIPENKIIIGCFNKMIKYSYEMRQTWYKILSKTVDSALILIKNNENETNAIYEESNEYKIDKSRIMFVDIKSRKDFLILLNRCDLCFDSDLVNGFNTSIDCILNGIPFLSLEGNIYHKRFGVSLLNYSNLGECIAKDYEDFEKKALFIINTRRYTEFEERLITMYNDIFDVESYVNELESSLDTAWDSYMKSLK